MRKVLNKSLRWYQVNNLLKLFQLSHPQLYFPLLGFARERERDEISNVEIKGTYPNLTAANQLLFHLGNRQGFFSARLYTFSIPSVAKASYIVKTTQFSEQETRQFTSGSHLCSLFVLSRKGPTWRVWKRLSDVCYNGRAWGDINFIPRSINY